jgi:hypothetical protein
MALVTLVAEMSFTAPAWSEEAAQAKPGADEVTLKNGGLVRGTVVSVEPGAKVVIMEGGAKESRTIPWAEVADVERGKYDPRPGGAGPGYPTPPPPAQNQEDSSPPPNQPGVVRLHIDSPEPVRVFQNRVMTQGYVGGYGFVAVKTDFVCQAPCDKVVDARDGSQFVLTGDMPAASFRLDDQQGDVEARVNPGSNGLRAGGYVGLSVGILGMLAGGTLMLVGALKNSSDETSAELSDAPPPREKSALVPIGGVVIGASTAVLIGGIVMIVAGRTGIDVEPRATPTKKATAQARSPRYWMGEF